MTTRRSSRTFCNIPAETTSFIGRRRQVADAVRLLRQGRLLTLAGAPGIGKTRLALRVAAHMRARFPDGVWLVELAALSDVGLLDQSFLDVLGLQCRPGQSVLDTLLEYLADKEMLLVVDNCHHLLDACVSLVSRLLATAPRLRVLTTSRQVLRVTGERVLDVPPLSTPDPDSPTTARATSRYEAVRLFADRAKLARRGFTVNKDNRTAVARICERMGGIPLAIELAALRVRAQSPEQMLNGLSDYFEFLVGGSRVAMPRLEPLGRAIDWSYDLCSFGQKTLWARLSVFPCDFDIEAVEEVCADAGLPRVEVLDLVTELMEKSILTRSDGVGVMRYRMLEPIRLYGMDKLRRAGEEAAMCRRHRDHYLGLAEQGVPDWFGPHQSEWLNRLRIEHANLRTALDFCLSEPGEELLGLRMASALWFYWTASGLLKEGRRWLDRALSLNPQPTRMRAGALWRDGRITVFQGDVPAAVSKLEECRTLAQQLGDLQALAYGTQMLGVASLFGGDLPRAATLLEEAVARHHANRELTSTALLASLQLALTRAFQSDLDGAVDLCEECLTVSDAHGETWARSYALYVLALVEWRRGKWMEATACVCDCLRLKRTFRDIVGLTQALELQAWIAAGAGNHNLAAVLLGVAQRYWPTFGLPLFGSEYFIAHHKTCESQTLGALGKERFSAAFRQGNRFTLAQGVAFALAEKTDSSQLT
ncbi:non-specific serine/threonine protein kinase [Kibdelosporangium aridum]|uniref:Non-specific serine/threonine protein kinase n=1 Tax=Kibdelosporangium aridum TaxID=2030 RepID=A0A1W2FFJ3_KIBAR|nr:non-specific serine/threonine protein kinase [Kibdelosporangium aridum]